jgi:hypothetical protein
MVADQLSARDNVPKSCTTPDIERYGQPVMFERRNGIAFGVSVPKPVFARNADATVYIWLSNESNQPQRYYMCCELTFFKKIDVFDASGSLVESAYHRMLRNMGKNYDTGFAGCSCSGFRLVQPGSCSVVDQGTLNKKGISYDLPPGQYTIREGLEADGQPQPKSHDENRASAGGRLAIMVTDR